MRRFLLFVFALFSITLLKGQVLLNEIYSSPKTVDGNHEFFELFNTSTTKSENLDCYALIVYYDYSDGRKGFRVIDFPDVTITPHDIFGIENGYMVGASTGDIFTVQKCATAQADFIWSKLNDPTYKDKNGKLLNTGSIMEYEICTSCNSGYQPATFFNPQLYNDFFYDNRTVDTKGTDNKGGFTFGVFLFKKNDNANKMDYVNGFLGGNNDGEVPNTISSLPDLPLSLKCGSSASTTVPLDWSPVKKAENVIETSGEQNADNGFIRCNDGKCGEWEKSSNPDGDCALPSPGEHTPNYRNGATGSTGVDDPNGLVLSTQTYVCGSRLDFAVTGIQGKTSCGNLTSKTIPTQFFPITVELWEDFDGDGKLTPSDQPSPVAPIEITQNDKDYHTFGTLSPLNSYFLVFKSKLECIDKIVPATLPTFTPKQTIDCGGLITFSINADFKLDFTANIYQDTDGDGDGDVPLPNGSFTINTSLKNFTYQVTDQYRSIPNYVIQYTSTTSDCYNTSDKVTQLYPGVECTVTPVNLRSFTANRNKLRVGLKWETLTEQNNRGFNVQRNTRGVWENRAFVFSAANGGNSTEPLEYSFNDDNNEKGVSQYRIQQVDMDGKVTYSPIRSVKGEGQIARTIIYPNPSGEGKVNVVYEGEGARNVIVSDINGRIVRQYPSVVSSLVIDNLDAGMYLFQITDLSTAETSVEKVIIKKR